MIIAHHIIFTTYGSWLPNDPRGSFSKEIYNAELKLLAPIQYGRQSPQPAREKLSKFWTASKPALKFPPLFLNENHRQIVAAQFNKTAAQLDLNVYACAIMPNHVHLLLAAPKHSPAYVVNRFKSYAGSALTLDRPVWTKGYWIVYINDFEDIETVVQYINMNPVAQKLPPQNWPFIKPL